MPQDLRALRDLIGDNPGQEQRRLNVLDGANERTDGGGRRDRGHTAEVGTGTHSAAVCRKGSSDMDAVRTTIERMKVAETSDCWNSDPSVRAPRSISP